MLEFYKTETVMRGGGGENYENPNLAKEKSEKNLISVTTNNRVKNSSASKHGKPLRNALLLRSLRTLGIEVTVSDLLYRVITYSFPI